MITGNPFIYTPPELRELALREQSAIQVWQKSMIDAITRLHEYQYTPQITVSTGIPIAIPDDAFYSWQYRQPKPNLLLLLED